MKTRDGIVIVLLLSVGALAPASAETLSGKVIGLAPDVYPFQGVVFKMDVGGIASPCLPICGYGPWLYYHYTSATDNGTVASDGLKAVYALVLSAWLSSQPIKVLTSATPAPNGGCAVLYVGPLRDAS